MSIALHEEIIASDVHLPYYLYLRKDGILYIKISSEKEETVELAKEMVQKLGKLVQYKKVPILAKHDEFAIPGKENREFWSKKDACPYSKAEAFIIQSTAMKLISNFYLLINKPERPTKMFTSEKDAIEWLKKFMD